MWPTSRAKCLPDPQQQQHDMSLPGRRAWMAPIGSNYGTSCLGLQGCPIRDGAQDGRQSDWKAKRSKWSSSTCSLHGFLCLFAHSEWGHLKRGVHSIFLLSLVRLGKRVSVRCYCLRQWTIPLVWVNLLNQIQYGNQFMIVKPFFCAINASIRRK